MKSSQGGGGGGGGGGVVTRWREKVRGIRVLGRGGGR